jgi:ubiquinone/menaquinone biosynthesis C-methylase UbiE
MTPPDLFDCIAPYYDRFASSERGQQLARDCPLPSGGRLLDAAGGTGRVSHMWAGQASQIVVADTSMKMLSQAHKKAGLQPVACAAEALPFVRDCFDGIIMVDALHHVVEPDAVLGELWRVLAAGGRLVINEPDIRRFSVRLVGLGEKLLGMRSHFLHHSEITEKLCALGAEPRLQEQGHAICLMVDKAP